MKENNQQNEILNDWDTQDGVEFVQHNFSVKYYK